MYSSVDWVRVVFQENDMCSAFGCAFARARVVGFWRSYVIYLVPCIGYSCNFNFNSPTWLNAFTLLPSTPLRRRRVDDVNNRPFFLRCRRAWSHVGSLVCSSYSPGVLPAAALEFVSTRSQGGAGRHRSPPNGSRGSVVGFPPCAWGAHARRGSMSTAEGA